MCGSPCAPESSHQPGIGVGVGIIAASGFCICCGISSQLQNKTATVPARINRTGQAVFMKRPVLTRTSLGVSMRNIEDTGSSVTLVDGVHQGKYGRFMATLTKNASFSEKERARSTVQPPINLENWIEENREKFKPPVSNRYLYDGRDFFVMVIKGPNARNDFHLVDSEEYFYQLKGDIKVRVREGDRIV